MGYNGCGKIWTYDDDENHMHSLTIKTGYDKDNPRTEFVITVH